MISVLIECHNNEAELARTLSALVSGAVEGVVSDVAVIDKSSMDGSSEVADAAGCEFYPVEELVDAFANARGNWVLLIEPGARPVNGWIEIIAEHATNHGKAAKFSASKTYRLPLRKRLFRKKSSLQYGLLLPKNVALENAKNATSLAEVAKVRAPVKLPCEMVPAAYSD